MTSSSEQRVSRFTALYEEYVPMVRAYVRTKTTVDDAEAVVQATFETAWSRLEIVPLLSERAWLFGVARNHMRNQHRANRRRSNLVEAITAARPTTDIDLYTGDLDPAEREQVRRALDQLSELDREIVQLTAWHDFSSTEVAQVLEISPANVRIRLHRTRQKLAPLLIEDGEVAS
ncbi:MAG: RNA polymerase sigma factor [Ilumatobacteraceae bacterium]